MSTEDLLKMLPTKVNMSPLVPAEEPIKLKPTKEYAKENGEEKTLQAKISSSSITPMPSAAIPTLETIKVEPSPKQLKTEIIKASVSDISPKEKLVENASKTKSIVVAENQNSIPQTVHENTSVLMPIQSPEYVKTIEKKTEKQIEIASSETTLKNEQIKTEPAAGQEETSLMPISIAPPPPLTPKTTPIIPTQMQPETSKTEQKEPESMMLASAMPKSLVAPETAEKEAALNKEAEKKIEDAALQKASQDAALKKIQIWEAKEGSSLKKTLQKWSEQAHVPLVWNSEENHKLKMDVYVSGTFENALKTLFSMGVKNPPKQNLERGEKYELVISDG